MNFDVCIFYAKKAKILCLNIRKLKIKSTVAATKLTIARKYKLVLEIEFGHSGLKVGVGTQIPQFDTQEKISLVLSTFKTLHVKLVK